MRKYHKIHTLYERDPATNHKTLIEGVYQLPEFDYLHNADWVFTEKIDGTNIRVLWEGDTLSFKGKSDKAQIPTHLLDALNEQFQPKTNQLRRMFPDGKTCLYGEGYGPKIQKNGDRYRNSPGFILFDIRIDSLWLDSVNVTYIAQDLNIDLVPTIDHGTLSDFVALVKNGFSSFWDGVDPEGLVARPKLELQTRRGKRIITKLKQKDFSH